jgi:hypothetical protein
MPDFTLTQEQYEALVAMARKGADNPHQLTLVEQYLKTIEEDNGITRDFVLVQWQEQGAKLPVGANFPETWPPQLRQTIELVSRAIARADVEAMLEVKANDPIDVLVTRDPAGLVGWATLDDFFR